MQEKRQPKKKHPVRGLDDHLKYGDHVGTHPVLMERLLDLQGGDVWRRICQKFFRSCLRASPEAAATARGLALVVICDFGKHRSPAAMALLMWCMNMRHWEVERRYMLLNRRLQTSKQTSKHKKTKTSKQN